MCSYDHVRKGRIHTLLTSTVSHAKLPHFAINTYGLALFGGLAASGLSEQELGVLLVSCGGAASLSHILCQPRNPVLGASGMLMGVVTVDGLLAPQHRFNMILPLPGLTFSMLQVADLCLVANVAGFLVLRRYGSSVAWASHVGGTVAGLGFALCGWLRGDSRFANPWRLHVDNCASDWLYTAVSIEDAAERIRGVLSGRRPDE